ncbi:MAG: hypothetical protein IJO14_01050 [Clostridia bacterium]|nr:hypothetical protein [Clostridia bacterium]
MITFSFLNKNEFHQIAPVIFSILADNMEKIAPTGNTRQEDYACWYTSVKEGLQREERQMILIHDDENLVGFFQYFTNTDTFRMEEIQFAPDYQGVGLFRPLCGFVKQNIRQDLASVDAYANIHNEKSIGILTKMGLKNTGLNKNGRSYHFEGSFADLKKWYET